MALFSYRRSTTAEARQKKCSPSAPKGASASEGGPDDYLRLALAGLRQLKDSIITFDGKAQLYLIRF
jgi:hypothetical protein